MFNPIRSSQFLLLAVLAFHANSASIALPEPQLEWTRDLGIGTEGSPVAYPAENPDSVVIGNGGRVFRISGNGALIFDKTFPAPSGPGGLFYPRVADLDGDGNEEIVSGHNAGYVFALEGATGGTLWHYQLGAELDTWRMATPADLDGDGKMEVIATDMDGWVTCLSHDGQLLWRSKVEEYRLSTPAVGDIDSDGRPEIVYGTATRHVIALEADGTFLWDSFVPPHHLGRCHPLIADLDEDGAAEVYVTSSMIGVDSGLVSLNGFDGSVRWVRPKWNKSYHGRNVVKFSDGTQGVLVCDVGNNVGAYDANGNLRWRKTLNGRGIWTTPAVGDVDGDGAHEVIVAVRGTSNDGKQSTWYVLSSEGELLGSYGLGDGYGAALIADVDRDGLLEVVLASRKGVVHCYSFGGRSTEGSVISSSWADRFYPLRNLKGKSNPTQEVPSTTFIAELPEPHYGNNRLSVELPISESRLGLEVTTQAPNLSRTTQVFHPKPGARNVGVVWPVKDQGPHKIAFRLLDQSMGKVMGRQEVRRDALDLVKPIADSVKQAIQEINGTSGEAVTSDYLLFKAKLRSEVESRFGLLQNSIIQTKLIDPYPPGELPNEVDGFLTFLGAAKCLMRLLGSEWSGGNRSPFVLWQDENPWDNLDPIQDLPDRGGPLQIEAWAFGNEIESVCINAVNLSPKGTTLRVEPGTLKLDGATQTLMAAEKVADLRRAVALPSRFKETVPDLLPSLGPDYLLDIAPMETRQLWINLSSRDLEAGIYILNWTVRTLDLPSATTELTIRFTVSPVRLPEKSRYLSNFWSRNKIGELSAVENLNDHLQTIWYSLPMPSAKVDANGKLVGELDWKTHDEVLAQAEQVELILYSGPPSPTFPDGVEVSKELRLAADRNYANAVVEHLRTFGLDYKNFMYYIEDETGLNAGPEHYIERASYIKKIDPRLQCYANPWGGITKEHIEAMWPVTDVWQPGMETIEYLGPDYVNAMRPGGKRIAMYTPPGNCRVLRPLGFFRAQAWQAFHWGIEGGGWWVYHGDDLWQTDPDREPGYGGVYYDGRALVDSRRWEANRDGIEDFNLLCLLRDHAAANSDAEAMKVLDEAVNYVAAETITGVPREAADYDFDFAVFMEHRRRIRDVLERP